MELRKNGEGDSDDETRKCYALRGHHGAQTGPDYTMCLVALDASIWRLPANHISDLSHACAPKT
eukprot:IDg23248t1